jgi:hypothetical protein
MAADAVGWIRSPLATTTEGLGRLTDLLDSIRAELRTRLKELRPPGEVPEEALPGGATGYRFADDRTGPSASGREGETG